MSRKIWSGFARRTLLLGTRKTEPLPHSLDGKRAGKAEDPGTRSMLARQRPDISTAIQPARTTKN